MTSLPRRIENSSAQLYAGPALTGEPSTMKTRRDISLVAESSTEARPKRILEPATTPGAPLSGSRARSDLFPKAGGEYPARSGASRSRGRSREYYELRIL
jgi:hypothetical protein